MKIIAPIFFMMFIIPMGVGAEYDYNSKVFQSIVSQLDMQGHADDDFATCSVKQLYYEEVLEMLNDGMTEEEIIQYYVDEYGQAALREPGTDTNGIVAWSMPIVGVIVGIFIVVFWLRKVSKKDAHTNSVQGFNWESEMEKEIAAKIFDEERRKYF